MTDTIAPPPQPATRSRAPLVLVMVGVLFLVAAGVGYKFLKAHRARLREDAARQSAQKAATVSPQEARRLQALADARALAAGTRPDVRDRGVTNEQKSKFVKTLKTAPRGAVIVFAQEGHRESFLYAAKIANLLHDAGFGPGEKALDFVPASDRPNLANSVFLIVSREVGIPKHAIAIKDALEVIGIRCDFTFRESMERPKELQICIFQKPDNM